MTAFGRPPRGGRGLKYPGPNQARLDRRRPPRGGRGLKSKLYHLAYYSKKVAPLAGGVD